MTFFTYILHKRLFFILCYNFYKDKQSINLRGSMKLLIITMLAIMSYEAFSKQSAQTIDFEVVAIPGTNNHHMDRPIKDELTRKDELMHFTGYCTNEKGRGIFGDMVCHVMVVKFHCSDVGFFRGVSDFTSYGDIKSIVKVNLSKDLKNLKFRLEDGSMRINCELQKRTEDIKSKFYCRGTDKIKNEVLVVKGSRESVNLKKWCDKSMTLRGLDYL